MCFRKRKQEEDWEVADSTEERLQQIIELVKDLDKKEFNKLQAAIELVWQGYDKVRQVQTTEEKVAKTSDNDGLGEFLEENK